MAYNPARHLKPASQREPLDAAQVKNNAGGYVFKLEPLDQLRRFLILGSEGGTYYASEQSLTRENTKVIEECLKTTGLAAVELIREVSVSGLAPRNKPALYALAVACAYGVGDSNGDPSMKVRQTAFDVIPEIARTGSDLLWFCSQVYQMRGKGTGLRNAIRKWFNDKTPEQLAYQAIKYRQRDGWALRDLLRMSKPVPASSAHDAIFDWLVHQDDGKIKANHGYDQLIQAHYLINGPKFSEAEAALAIRQHRLPWEVVPDELKSSKVVWDELLQHMPMHAMVRQLGKLTSVGSVQGKGLDRILDQLENAEALAKSRMHPFQLLQARSVYEQGHGVKGSLKWEPNTQVVSALEKAFYKAFQTVKPSGKRILLSLDVSGSMGSSDLFNSTITAREGSIAMAMVTQAVERHSKMMAFSNNYMPLKLSTDLRKSMDMVSRLPHMGTDCSLPMLRAIEEQWDIDQFVIYTDNETYAGKIHPKEALKLYRRKSGISEASLVVVGMTSTGFSIADPRDPRTLDVVGFDASTPRVLSWFAGARDEPEIDEG